MRFLVTFISPKRSARTLQVAADHARAVGAEIIVLKVVPDAQKVGVIAELIATDRPVQKATQQVAKAAEDLDRQGIAARGLVKVDQVIEGILHAAIEWHVDAVYVGSFQNPDTLCLQNDPIARFLIDRCPANVVLVRQLDPGEDQAPLPMRNPALAKPIGAPAQPFRLRRFLVAAAAIFLMTVFAFRFGNTHTAVEPTSTQALSANTRATLMDWHVSGLWVINCPVAWVHIDNYNSVPIKNIVIEYKTYNAEGKLLDTGEYEIDGTVQPNSSKNFIELYLGLVALESERLSVRLLSVKRA